MTTRPSPGRRACRACTLALVFCLTAASVLAQTPPGGIAPPPRPERPYRGLFGGDVGSAAQSLTFEGNLGGGVVDNPLGAQGAAGVQPATSGEASWTGSAALSYGMRRARWGADAEYNSFIDYYPGLGSASMWDRHFISGQVYFMPSPSTRIAVMPAFKNVAELSTADLFDPLVELGVPPIQDMRLSLTRYRRYGATAEFSHQLSTRSRITGDLNYGHGKLEDGKEWVTVTGSADFRHSISKGMTLSLGYTEGGQRDIVDGVPLPTRRQPRIRAGIDFDKPISFSRRTLVGFSTGLAGTQNRGLHETTYYLIGSARLIREFGRTWNAGVTYNRNLRHIEPLAEAVLSDSVTAGVKGSFSNRVQFQSGIGYATFDTESTASAENDVEATGSGNQFGSIQLSIALTRLLALGADYTEHRYYAVGSAQREAAIGRRSNRSFRTYLQVSLPLMTQTRKP